MAAVKKPSILKPGTIDAASIKSKTLMTKEKRPRVKIVNGRAIIWRIGRKKVLITPITTAATIAERISVKTNPGKIDETINSEKI
jgi:hypothetical protein